MLGWLREWQRRRDKMQEIDERIAWRKAHPYQPHELSKMIVDEYTGELIWVRGDDPRPEVRFYTSSPALNYGLLSGNPLSGNPLSGSSSATPFVPAGAMVDAWRNYSGGPAIPGYGLPSDFYENPRFPPKVD